MRFESGSFDWGVRLVAVLARLRSARVERPGFAARWRLVLRLGTLPLALGMLGSALVAQAGADVYWANHGSDTIGRAKLDGSELEQSFITAADPTSSVTIDAGHVYWTNYYEGTIGRAKLDGTEVEQSFITGANHPAGVAVDAGHVYWTNYYEGTIGRAKLDGTEVEQSFITGANEPYGVTVDAEHVYWANYGSDTIGRANLDSTEVEQSFITGANGPVEVCGRRRTRLLGQLLQRHDRAGEPRRQRTRTELHHRRERAVRGGGRRRTRLLGQLR